MTRRVLISLVLSACSHDTAHAAPGGAFLVLALEMKTALD